MIAILADAFIKATVLLLVAAATTVALRHSAAALRHLVWALGCGAVLALPLASPLLPNWRLGVWPRFDAPTAFRAHRVADAAIVNAPEESKVTHAAPPAVDRDEATPVVAASAARDVTPAHWRLSTGWTALVLPVWLSGVAAVLVLLAIGLARTAWLDRMTPAAQDDEWLLLMEKLSSELGITRSVRLLQAAGPTMPMTWGIRRPAILLPAEANEWPLERRRDVLLHELAHVKRHDFLTQLIARIACAVYWFHPLVWLAAARLRVERERACDDQVLRAGVKPSTYATHLLEIARGLRVARATSLASVAMARPTQLATRLLEVLDTRRRRDTLSVRSAVPAWIAAIAVVVPLAAVAPRVAEPVPPAPTSREPWIDTIPPLPSPVLIQRRAAKQALRPRSVVADTLRDCGTEGSRRSSHSNEGEDVVTVSTTTGHCIVNFDGNGKFTFNTDFTDITSVAAGGRVVIDVNYGAHDRRLTIRRGDGGLERVYKVDGDVRPFDDGARAWLSETLTFLMRRTGFMAQERSRWILEKRGVQGLLDETALLEGDYARRIYYQAAIESGKLDVAGYERVVDDAGSTIKSDYELAELLIAVAKAQPLTERMQAGFVNAAKSIGSDYERHRVLKAALSRPGLTAAAETTMLGAAADIHSDYELATLLIELNEARPIDDAVRPAFFNAANALSSDYEHGRVLSAVVSRTGTGPAMLADVLQSAQTIHSDYELTELLRSVGSAYVLDDTLRPLFFAAASTIASDYERARALTSVIEHGDVTRPVALAILESAKGISSDHDMAELLIALTRRARMDDTVSAAIRAEAETIGSQYDRGRVYEALVRVKVF